MESLLITHVDSDRRDLHRGYPITNNVVHFHLINDYGWREAPPYALPSPVGKTGHDITSQIARAHLGYIRTQLSFWVLVNTAHLGAMPPGMNEEDIVTRSTIDINSNS
jgi:hypothetical protein